MKKISSLLAGSFAALAMAQAQAAAVNIDFTTFGPGVSISSLQDVSFAVQGVGTTGTPATDTWWGPGLTNSTTGAYPTGSILDIKFDGAASDIAFGFNNYGCCNGSFYTAIGSHGAVLGTGLIDSYQGSMVNLGYTGVEELQLSNNGSAYWMFTLTSLSANVSAVPESSNALMMLAGAGLLAAAARRRSLKN